MRIVHISQNDSGGAGLAALRLHKALLSVGQESFLLCLNKNTNEENVVRYTPSIFSKIISHTLFPYKQNKYKQFVKLYDKDYECTSFPDALFDISKHPLVQSADIVNLHWVGSMLNYQQFFSSVRKPIVWTLHDQNPFLGIAHYYSDQKKNKQHLLLENKLMLKKTNAIHKHGSLTIVALNEWMRRLSEGSKTFASFPHYIIKNCVDTSIFKYYDKKQLKNLFGVPTNLPVFMFVSQHVDNPRKGFDLLAQALSFLDKPSYLIVVGRNIDLVQRENVLCLNTVKDERLMAFLYAASDAFILPSREDNLPNTMLESLCCGTPVITMPTGGMLDVINDSNGILAEDISVSALTNALNVFIQNKDAFSPEKIAENARLLFSSTEQANSYIELYENILTKRT